MPKSRLLRQTVCPTLVVSVVLAGWCCAAGVALAVGVAGLDRLNAAERAVIWGLIALGGIAACGGIIIAWRADRAFQRSFEEVSQRVRIAAERLGCHVPDQGSQPEDLLAQVRGLLEGIDRVIEERQQREREVLRADQLAMVGQIAAGVAHELRNPLTSVKLLIQTNLREAGRQGLPTDDLEIIEQEIRRMEKSLQRFLDFARPPRPERRPISLSLLVERTLALVDGRARKQHVTLEFTPPPVPVVVEADEDQIQQLLVNLVLNALDAMPDGGRIEIDLPPRFDGHAELQVRDTGPGIPTDLFPRLFDPFVSTKETGIGLGLAVSHRIAARHGGSLSAVNRPEGGACFVLRLPASQLVTSMN